MKVVPHERVVAVREDVVTEGSRRVPDHDHGVLLPQEIGCQGVEVSYPVVASYYQLFASLRHDHVLQNEYQRRVLEILGDVGGEHVQAPDVVELLVVHALRLVGRQASVSSLFDLVNVDEV